jgi:NADPH:quinone reductase-like Zn-dependent oxidoreductase
MNVPSSMQALQTRGPGELALTTLPTPVPGPREVLIQIITHRIPFANWSDAFTLARDGHDRALNIALTFPEAA